MKIIVIDNYDSFTYNLVHLLASLGAEVDVVRNDAFALSALEAYDKIVLSPGPGLPSEAGLTLDVIHTYADRKPMLGICLGHQAIGEAFGGRLTHLETVCHGVASDCRPMLNDYLFEGIDSSMTVGRYHSWAVNATCIPRDLEVTAVSSDGTVMALRHRTLDVRGVQFHPESILTPQGRTMMSNWLRQPTGQVSALP